MNWKQKSGTVVTDTVERYGGYTELSDRIITESIDNNVVEATKLIGSQAGRTLDSVVREKLNAGTNVQYAEGKKKFMRITATVFAIMLIILYAFVSCAGTDKKEVIFEEQEEQRIEYAGIEEYEVQAFDTLSHIACKYIPSDDYMQQWISDVKKLNGRKTSDIYFGEIIKVFTYEKSY